MTFILFCTTCENKSNHITSSNQRKNTKSKKTNAVVSIITRIKHCKNQAFTQTFSS